MLVSLYSKAIEKLFATSNFKISNEASFLKTPCLKYAGNACISAALVAGLTGLGTLLSDTHYYSLAFPSAYAFTGLSIALLGRNHPVGIFFGAFLWSFLERAAGVLDLEGVPPEIIIVMQGTIVISIVVAYELVARINLRQQQRAVGTAATAEQGA